MRIASLTCAALLVAVTMTAAAAQVAVPQQPPATSPQQPPTTTAPAPGQTVPQQPAPPAPGQPPVVTGVPPVVPPPVITPVLTAARTFIAKTGMIFQSVRPERVVDFETVIGLLQDALEKSTDPTVQAQAKGWRMFKATEPGPNATVLYVFLIDPAVPGAEYGLGRILADAYPDKIQEIWKLYTGSLGPGATLLNLMPVEAPPLAPGATMPAPTTTTPAPARPGPPPPTTTPPVTSPPATETTPPAAETTPPAAETTPPATGTTPPATGTTPPATGTTPPGAIPQ